MGAGLRVNPSVDAGSEILRDLLYKPQVEGSLSTGDDHDEITVRVVPTKNALPLSPSLRSPSSTLPRSRLPLLVSLYRIFELYLD